MVRKFRVRVNNKNYDVEVEELSSSQTTVSQVNTQVQQPAVPSAPKTVSTPVQKKPEPKPQTSVTVNEGETIIESPMAGVIVEVLANIGAHVKRGDTLLVLEAMKMENNILATRDGIVKSVNVSKGQEVEVGAPLIILE